MISREGWPWLIAVGVAGAVAVRIWGDVAAWPFVALASLLFLLFRDPARHVPPEPLAVLAPVDGRVIEVAEYTDAELPDTWIRLDISANPLGAYTVRAPIEGAIDSMSDHIETDDPGALPAGMWLHSEERHDVVLMFPTRFHWLAPRTFLRYGERVGQGQRFAYLRLAPRARMYLPAASLPRVAVGDRVRAGETVIAELPDASL